MPEIIEAEITKQKLAFALKGKRILEFWTDWPNGLISQKKNPKKTARSLKGRRIDNLEREGKAVVIHLDGGKILALHQRMSGSVIYVPSGADADLNFPKEHIHFRFKLDNGAEFVLLDPRKFGKVWYGSEEWFVEQPYIKNLGIDAMKIGEKEFMELFESSSATAKSFLLQQDKIAGLGNVVCDEILWKAHIHPRRKVKDLTEAEIHKLYKAMYSILASVLKHGGTSMANWYHPDGEKGSYQKYFKIYKKDFCRRCNITVSKDVVSGRGTYFCPECQK